MDRNPFIPKIPASASGPDFALIGGLSAAILLAGSALAIAVGAIDGRPITDRDPLPTSAAPGDEPRCHATDRIVRSGSGKLLCVSRFVACEADADHDGVTAVAHDVDCSLDQIGCLILLSSTGKDFGGDTKRTAALDLIAGGSN